MAYDENIRIIAEEVERLKNQIHNLDVEIPEHPSTDAGKILSIDSDGDLEWRNETPYIPPAYSTTEVDTGQKWIDGKNVYCKVYSCSFDTIESTQNVTIEIETGINIFDLSLITITAGGTVFRSPFNVSYSKATGNLSISSVTADFSQGSYIFILYYTKPEPVPSTETKTKKKGAN